MRGELEVIGANLENMIMRLEHTNAVLSNSDFLKGDEVFLLNKIINSSKEIGSLGNQASIRATELFSILGEMAIK